LVVLVVLAIHGCVCTERSSPKTSPLLLWSNTNYFTSRNEQIVPLVSTDDIEAAFQQSNKENAIKNFVNANVKPEVIAVFIQPHLKTTELITFSDARNAQPNGGAFKNLKRFVETSPSSLVLPYVFSTHNIQERPNIGTVIVDDIIKHLPSSANVIVASNDAEVATIKSIEKVKVISLNELSKMAHQSHWDILSNGVTDVIVVYLDKADQDNSREVINAGDDYMNNIVASLKRANYVAAFTADSPVDSIHQSFPSTHPVLQRFAASVQQVLDETYVATNDDGLMPDSIVEALLVMLPFLIILFVGVCCTYNIQSVLKFDAERPKRQ